MARLFISYGIPKSASTFAWQLIKRIALAGGLRVATLSLLSKGRQSPEDYIDPVTDENLQLIRADVGDAPVVIKTHGGPTAAAVRLVEEGEAVVFASYRDLRDVALSLLDHGARSRARGIADFAELRTLADTTPLLDDQIARLEQWRVSCAPLLIPYDEICFDTGITIERIAARLGVAVDAAAISAEFAADKGAIGQLNKGEHRRFERELSAGDSAMIVQRFHAYYQRYLPDELGAEPARPGTDTGPATGPATEAATEADPWAGGEAASPLFPWAVKHAAFWQAERPERERVREKLASLNREQPDSLLLRIAAGTVTRAAKPPPLSPSATVQRRFTMYQDFIAAVVRQYCPDLHCELLVDVGDLRGPDQSAPIFAFQKPRFGTSFLLPDVDFLGFEFYENNPLIDDRLPFEEKQCSAIFAGSTTGAPLIDAGIARSLTMPRLRAARYFRDHDAVRFALTNIVQCDSPETINILACQGFSGARIGWHEQFRHKFLISMDGNGAACSRVAIALRSNCVLLKYESPHELYYFAGLQPWVHYIPIQQDRDVIWVIEAERRRPGIFKHIAESGKEFSENFLTRESAMEYTALTLRLYDACFADRAPNIN
ncbi:MAG TPA: glycosyl transferase family 90 [Stellaceae bacterium]|nr:glycosyl transferase family 90 [Stellaceae bacterium]